MWSKCSLPESGQDQLEEGHWGLGESNAAWVDEDEPLNLLKESFLSAAQRAAGTEYQRCYKRLCGQAKRGRKFWGFSKHQRCLLSSKFWASELDGKHWQWPPAAYSKRKPIRSFVKDQMKRYNKEEGSAAFHKLWEKILLSLQSLTLTPTFQKGFGIKKILQVFLFILSVFKYLATECRLLKTGSLWFDVCYFTYLPLRRKWNIIRKVFPIFPHIGSSQCRERD